MKDNSKGGVAQKVALVLSIIGALNWGLVGVGIFIGKNWNVVELLLGNVGQNVAWLEAVVYLLVGLAGLVLLFGGCGCRSCNKNCDKCQTDDGNSESTEGSQATTAETSGDE